MDELVVVVVAYWFGVDEDAVDFGGFEFELVFEAGDDVVDVLHLEGVGEGAVAGDVEAVADASDDDVVDVEDLGEALGGVAEVGLDLAVALDADRRLDGRGLALDVGEDGVDLWDFVADLVFDAADEFVGLAEGHGLVDFDVLFDVELAVDRLHGDVVKDDVVARGDGADLVEDAFGDGFAGDGVDDDIGAGDDALHGGGGVADEVLGVLKGEMAR